MNVYSLSLKRAKQPMSKTVTTVFRDSIRETSILGIFFFYSYNLKTTALEDNGTNSSKVSSTFHS